MSGLSSKKSRVLLEQFNEGEDVKKGGMSVFFVICCVVLIPIAISLTASTTLLTQTCDNQINKIEASGESNTELCFVRSEAQLKTEANDFLQQTSIEIAGFVTLFMERAEIEALRLDKLLYLDNPTVDFAYARSLLREMYLQLYSASGKGLQAISIHVARDESVVAVGVGVIFLSWSIDSNTYIFGDSLENGTLNASTATNNVGSLYEILIGDDIDSGKWDAVEWRWSRIKLLPSGTLGMDVLGKRGDVVIGVNFVLDYLSNYLSKTTTELQSHGSTNRLFLVMADTTFGQQDCLVAASHGVTSKMVNATLTPIKDVESDDELVRGLAQDIHEMGSYNNISQHNQVTLTAEVNKTKGDHIVIVKNITDSFALNLWLITSIDIEYVLGPIEVLHQNVRVQIAKDHASVEESVKSDRKITFIMVAGVALAMMIVALVVSIIIIWPLREIQKEMSEVAEMRLNGLEVTTGSRIREVHSMQTSFLKMISNLREYRTYVPESVLGGSSQDVPPPTGNITLVFTDIEGSTALWKKNSAAMNSVMEIHNNVIRKAYRMHSGYEVKTIGDAFMIAFEKAEPAVLCCMEIIEQLALQTWPKELELPDAGLQVRLGCHVGHVLAEDNPLTSRIDYRGNTVNLASRVEGKARGGTLCITEDVKLLLPTSSRYVITPYDTHDIKGLGGGYVLHLVEPAHMSYASERKYSSNASSMTGGSTEMRSKSSSGGVVHGSSSSDARSGHLAAHKKTGLSLQTSMGTVAVCRLNRCDDKKIFDSCNTMVRAATEMAFTTEGTLGSVTGDMLTVLWNCSKACTLHVMSALRFAADLERRVGPSIMHVGIATGKLMHGNVGTRTTRFNTVFGLPLETAEVALEFAVHLDAFCMLVDASSHHLVGHDHTLKSFVRPVDTWTLSDESNIKVHFYHLMSSILNNVLESWDTASTDPPASAHTFSACMREVLGGNRESPLTTLQTLAATTPEDVVLGKIVAMIADDSYHASTRLMTLTRLPPFIMGS